MDVLNNPFPYNGVMENKPTSILIIEEHPLMRESLFTAIADEPDLKIVEPSPDNENAFQLIVSDQHDVLFLTHIPDIILFSLGNPGLQDLAALTGLRKKLKNTPILALTRDEVPGQEQAALEYGAQAVLTKAASREELLETLRALKTNSQFISFPVERKRLSTLFEESH